MKVHLFEDYFLDVAEDINEFNAFLSKHMQEMYPDTLDLNLAALLSEEELSNTRILSGNLRGLYWLKFYITYKDEKVGWCMGHQLDHETFLMDNTAVFKKHQHKGVYKAILPVLLTILNDKGFQKVGSRHAATNNRILIPKLKMGFVITGFEISDTYGILVHLTYYFNEARKQVLDFRIGEIQPTKKMAKAMSLNIT